MKSKKLSAAQEAATKADVASEDQAEEPPAAETITAIIPEKPTAKLVRAAPKPAMRRPVAGTTNVSETRRAEAKTSKVPK